MQADAILPDALIHTQLLLDLAVVRPLDSDDTATAHLARAGGAPLVTVKLLRPRPGSVQSAAQTRTTEAPPRLLGSVWAPHRH